MKWGWLQLTFPTYFVFWLFPIFEAPTFLISVCLVSTVRCVVLLLEVYTNLFSHFHIMPLRENQTLWRQYEFQFKLFRGLKFTAKWNWKCQHYSEMVAKYAWIFFFFEATSFSVLFFFFCYTLSFHFPLNYKKLQVGLLKLQELLLCCVCRIMDTGRLLCL